MVALDIPSGLDGRTGYPVGWEQGGIAVRAAETVTFHRPKAGLFLGEGLDCSGRVTVSDIGIAAEWDDASGMAVFNRGDRLMPARKRNTHKGSYGRVLVLGGSVGMFGSSNREKALNAPFISDGHMELRAKRHWVPGKTVQAFPQGECTFRAQSANDPDNGISIPYPRTNEQCRSPEVVRAQSREKTRKSLTASPLRGFGWVCWQKH